MRMLVRYNGCLQMKIIDIHHHWVNEDGYIDRLIAAMDLLGIEQLGLIALGKPFQRLFLTSPEPVGCSDNHDLIKAVREWPDRFFGYGFFHLGKDAPELIDWFADNGLRGVKFHIPAWNYDDDRCFPVYDRAAALQLPCLFHTGVFYLPQGLPGERISSARCRPIMLDPIANEFPSLNLIIAHLGVCWGEEAATLCRIYPNIFADLSGRVDGWLSSKSIDWFREILYWPEAHRKILFGSDVHCSEIKKTLARQVNVFQGLGWTSEQIKNVMYNNARSIFGF